MKFIRTFSTPKEAVNFSEFLYRVYGRDKVKIVDYPLFSDERGHYTFHVDQKEIKYRYAIIRINHDQRINKKYSFEIKHGYEDGSEEIVFQQFTDKHRTIKDRAMRFKSWWDYPLGEAKLMDGKIISI